MSAVALGGCKGDDTSAEAGDTGDAADETAPEFAGVVSVEATGETSALVTWDAATDDVSAADAIQYRVYVADAAGAQDFEAAAATTAAGETSIELQGLGVGREQFVVVRALDEAGNEDDNTVEASALTLDNSPPDFEGIKEANPTGPDAVELTWEMATDNGADSDEIRFQIFVADASGEQDFSAPDATTDPGATSFTVTGLVELQEYFFVVRAVDNLDNVDDNTIQRNATTLDGTPPNFGGVSTVVAAGNAIQASWSPATDNFSPEEDIVYDLYLSTTEDGFDLTEPTFSTMPGVLSHSFVDLDLSTEYWVLARARDAAGNQEGNNVKRNATTGDIADATPPMFFGLIVAIPQTTSSVFLAWDEAEDDVTPQEQIVYDIFFDDGAGQHDFGNPDFTTAPGETNFEVTGLEPGTPYYAIVRARDIAGNSDDNETEHEVAPLADTTPPTFGGLDTAVALSPTSIQLDWIAATDDIDDASDIVYRINMATVAGDHDYELPEFVTDPGETSFTLTDLTPDTDYFFVVKAQDTSLNFDPNQIERNVATLADTTAPTFNGLFSANTLSHREVRLQWINATDDLTPAADIEFEIYVSTTPGGQDFGNPTAVSPPGATNYVVGDLIPGQEYYFVVRARDDYDNLDQNTQERTATPTPDNDPPTLGNVTITNLGFDSMTLNWEEATDNAWTHEDLTYEICSGTTALICDPFVQNSGALNDETSLDFTSLLAGTKYHFRIRAVDPSGNVTAASDEVTGVTSADLTDPTFGGATSAGNTTASSIQVSWNAATDDVTPAGAMVYVVYAATSSGAQDYGTPTAISPPGVTSFDVPNLESETQYFLVVRARDQSGNMDSNTVEVSATTTLDTQPPTDGELQSIQALSCTSLELQWSEGSDDATVPANMAYDICSSQTPTGCDGGSWHVDDTAVGVTTYTFNVANPGTWYVRVRPRDQGGNLGANTTVLNVNAADNGSPTWGATPTSSQTDFTPPGQVDLNWSAASDACWSSASLVYEICVQGSGFDNNCLSGFTVHETTAAGATSRNIQGLNTATNYTYYIRAVDGSGNTQISSPTSQRSGVSYSGDIATTIFTNTCNGCHDGNFQPGPWTRTSTVNQSASTCGGWTLVVPSNAGSSFIYNKMSQSTPACGTQMPQFGTPNSTHITNMGDWINQGALNN